MTADHALLAAADDGPPGRTEWAQINDAGGWIEFANGDVRERWRLPDQVGDSPELARIVVVTTTLFVLPNYEVPERFYLMCESSGRTLAVLAHGVDSFTSRHSIADVEGAWPERNFARLRARGVTVEWVSVSDRNAMRKQFPGSVSLARALLFSRAALRSYWALLALACIAIWLQVT